MKIKIKIKKVDKSSKEIEKKVLILDIKSNNEENEEDIFIDDDFEIGNSIAFFSDHFYDDDANILAYKQKIKNNDGYNQISENFYNDDENTIF